LKKLEKPEVKKKKKVTYLKKMKNEVQYLELDPNMLSVIHHLFQFLVKEKYKKLKIDQN